ncbi:hypothetical protein GA0061098_1002477 [Bradyrhizobium shewense]|uniref:4-amino-4-deoxy-L-arabinose transferase n=1 Tax=Bradyrhizobium shewense TaxID=1761772 RepID=A0A1C3UVB4_9BRAD|nr:hypothetical protein [Bradyrhizobium shewense]SCB19430.1 hypothetical protein GA0061098_1002477 [Bradyrhizobium shewense]
MAVVDQYDCPDKTGRESSGHLGADAWIQPSTAAMLVWLGLLAMEIIAVLALCDFRLFFTLDDAYIHLAVADQILSGGYGVNAGEYSSPSSSIIWPYFLALTEALHLGAFGPLLINAAAAGATILAIMRLLEASGLFDGVGERLFACMIALLLIFSTSAVALPMTGMEHSAHVWASIVTFAGLVAAARGFAPTSLHFLALVLLPLIRFEGIAFAGAAIVAFALLDQRRFAAGAALVIIVTLSGYVVLMASRGLPLLPSSVLLKGYLTTLDQPASELPAIVRNMLRSVMTSYGLRLIALGLAVAWCASLLRADRKVLIVLLTVIVAVGAHLACGQYGWFNRYEVYIMALAATALLWGVAQLKPRLSRLQWSRVKIGVVFGLGTAAIPYMTAAVVTPVGASDIYEQQYQMARFAQSFYRDAVGVNDLGLVAYGNTKYTLDLWGLGSEQVRKARMAGDYGPAEMAALAHDYDVGLIMIYEGWFEKGVPSSWTKVAVLQTRSVTLSRQNVDFYRTPLADAAAVDAALRAFKATLPSRDRLDIIAP